MKYAVLLYPLLLLTQSLSRAAATTSSENKQDEIDIQIPESMPLGCENLAPLSTILCYGMSTNDNDFFVRLQQISAILATAENARNAELTTLSRTPKSDFLALVSQQITNALQSASIGELAGIIRFAGRQGKFLIAELAQAVLAQRFIKDHTELSINSIQNILIEAEIYILISAVLKQIRAAEVFPIRNSQRPEHINPATLNLTQLAVLLEIYESMGENRSIDLAKVGKTSGFRTFSNSAMNAIKNIIQNHNAEIKKAASSGLESCLSHAATAGSSSIGGAVAGAHASAALPCCASACVLL